MSAPIFRTNIEPGVERTPDGHDYLAPIHLSPSRRLGWAQLLSLLTMAAASAVAFLPAVFRQPAWWLVLLLFWGLLFVAGWGIRRWQRRGLSQVSYRQGDWYLTLSGVEYRAQLVGDAIIWPQLLVARYRLRASGARVSLVCLPDSARAEDFRRLRVWLRIYLWHARH